MQPTILQHTFRSVVSQFQSRKGMPPPPPSKSYLLVIDSDSSDDEDGYRIHLREDPRLPMSLISDRDPPLESPRVYTTPEPTVVLSRRRPHVIEDDEDEDLAHTSTEFEEEDEGNSSPRSTESAKGDETQKPTKNQKKKRSRRRNKKHVKSCGSNGQSRRIKFSSVSFRTYPRAFSEVVVPVHGGWPLGMELEPLLDGAPEDVTIDEYEAAKQERLKDRWEKLLQVKTVDESLLEQMTKRPDDGTPFALETRQWDYRNKMKNPLFGDLSEEQRQVLFLEVSSNDCEDVMFPLNGRARSNSVGDQAAKQDSSSLKRRERNSSFSHVEHFSEKYNQVYVHHVRNGLEQLRNERSKSGASGCNCRKLSVYIPPKNGGGKKAAHRRLKPSKLRDELKKRNLFDESKSREELEQILHDAVEKEPCCGSSDCFCFRNGIDCQADACSCWHDSHVHTKSAERYLSVQAIAERCGNPLGTNIVDMDAIDSYRARVLESSLCQFIGSAQ
jgi:hypothetical protein